MMPDWLPSVHPLIVHFPIALLIAAFLTDVVALILRQKSWMHASALWLYAMGALGVIGAYLTGQDAASSIEWTPVTQSAVDAHASAAEWVLWFFTFYVLFRLGLRGLRLTWMPYVWVILALPGLFFLYETGEHGAALVYRYGIGVQETSPISTHPSSDSLEVDMLLEALPLAPDEPCEDSLDAPVVAKVDTTSDIGCE